VNSYSGVISQENQDKYTLMTELLNNTNASIIQLKSGSDAIQTTISDTITNFSSLNTSLGSIHHHFNNAANSVNIFLSSELNIANREILSTELQGRFCLAFL